MKARICKEKHWNVHLRFFLVMMGDLLFSVWGTERNVY